MPEVKWRQFGNYSGPLVTGVDLIPIPTGNLSAERFHWLTTRVETGGTYGTIVMFDGTALTAGPDQFILVYPKELASEDFNSADDQGPLGALLARVLAVSTNSYAIEVQRLFKSLGWVLSPSGTLRYLSDQTVVLAGRTVNVKAGALIYGSVLRDELTPVGGRVPKTGPGWEQSAQWALRFNRVFSDPATFSTQRHYGLERMESAFKQRKVTVRGRATSIEGVLGGDLGTLVLRPDIELAFALWYSNSVNAPAIAMRCLQDACTTTNRDLLSLPKTLIQMLGSSNFGRWSANIPEGRYQRTRKAAMESKLWSTDLFMGPTAIMPTRF